jgi:hypothetical protein
MPVSQIVTNSIADSAVTTVDIADLAVTPAKMSQKLTSDTAKTATGTSVDFTGIPSWVKRITVMLRGVSLSGTSHPLIQIGVSTPTTTGYLSATTFVFGGTSSGSLSSTAGFPVYAGGSANINNSQVVITAMGSNSWISSHNGNMTNLALSVNGGGSVTLGAALNMVRITTVNGTDTFAAGTINILYE